MTYCGIVLGNLLAFATMVSFFVSGDFWGVVLTPILWPVWVLITTLIVTPVLGIVFTCGVVVYKSLLAGYHALPFVVERKV